MTMAIFMPKHGESYAYPPKNQEALTEGESRCFLFREEVT